MIVAVTPVGMLKSGRIEVFSIVSRSVHLTKLKELAVHKYARVRCHGSAIVEFGAALTLLLPFIIAIAFAAVEASQTFLIHSGLRQAAYTAARQLAIKYGSDPAGTMADPTMVFGNVKFLNIVNSAQQFSVPAGSAGWNTTAYPPTVTVLCTYQSGQHGLAVFPNPDPLNIGSSIIIKSTATCRLE